MKKFLVNVVLFALVGAMIVVLLLALGSEEGTKYVYKGNSSHKPLKIKPKEYQCSECDMNIDQLNYLVELITTDGETFFFDDIGCLVLWLENHHPDIDRIFTKTIDTHQWIEVEKVWYTRKAASPMGYGFAAVEKRGEDAISYAKMRELMLQGQTLHDPFVKKQLLLQK
jgi:hypothetical protein